MKRIDWKVKMQWNWYKDALLGTAIAVLAAPTAGSLIEVKSEDVENNPIVSAVTSITFGPKTKVMIDGEVVALAKNEEEATNAYEKARLAYNADGVKLLDVDVSYALVDKEKDKAAVKGKKLLREERLEAAILEELRECEDHDKTLAYTMRIDDYTVTVENMSDVAEVLEQAQSKYDETDRFKVGLQLPKLRNVTMYEVEITEQEAKKESKKKKEDKQTSSLVDADVKAQAVDDGVKHVGFSEKIQVMETYVDKDQLTTKEKTYEELTAQNMEPAIYVVQPGDSLSGIAAKYDMSVEDVKALNPGIESDDNIYYDDRLTVSVPAAAVEILVQKQETYKEDYFADTVYEDD